MTIKSELAPSDPLRLRLLVLRSAVKEARNAEHVAQLMIIVQEGLVSGHFLGFDLTYRNPVIEVSLKLAEPPWTMILKSKMPLERPLTP